MDGTHIKMRGKDKSLYRALDSTGQTVDSLLTDKLRYRRAKSFL
jgi:transposase-like protein